MKRSLLLGLIGIALLFGILPTAAQENACYDKGGNWDAELQKCQTRTGVTVTVDYPMELVGIGIAEQTVDAFISQTRADFIQSYTPDFSLPNYANNWEMDVSYERFPFSEDIFTLRLNMYYYTGGAHPNLDFKTFTFDLAQQKELTLADIFRQDVNPWPVIAPLVEQNIIEQLGEEVDTEWVHTGSGENPDNYQHFALTPDSLIFFFPPYQVTAYAFGPVTVEIPLAAISDLLNPEFIS